MASDLKILSYHDVVLRESDLELLRYNNQYLNDRIIEFHFLCLAPPKAVLLLPPAITFWISHCPESDTLHNFVNPLRLAEHEVVVFTVNDNQNVDVVDGGCHWSLLVYYRNLNKFEHYDSLRGVNVLEAKKIASIVKTFLGSDAISAGFEEAWTPQQENGYDCGLYVMAIAEVLLQAYDNGRVDSSKCKDLLKEKVTPPSVNAMRKTILNTIIALAKEQKRL